MTKLGLTLPYSSGESPLSFASRLAGRNFCTHLREFCADMMIDVNSLIDGDAEAIEELAVLGGVDPTVLTQSTLVRQKNLSFRLNKASLSKEMLQRMIPNVCPVCAAEDIAAGPGGSHLAIAGRTLWQIAPVKTCLRHKTLIVDLGIRHWPGYAHDFAYYMKEAVPQILSLAKDAPEIELTADQVYLASRLAPDFQASESWLDTLSFSAAAKLMAVVGAVREFGRKVSLEKLSNAEISRALTSGFAVIKDGVDAFRDYLRSLQDFDESGGSAREQAMFGGIHRWLNTPVALANPELTPIIDVVRDFVVETMPVAEGDVVLGKPNERRRIHSVFSAAKVVGIHTKTARKAFTAGGFISTAQSTRSDHNTLFPAESSERFLRRFAEGMPSRAIQQYLNASRPLEELMTNVYLKPIIDQKGMEPLYHPDDLDAFYARMIRGAVFVEVPTARQVGIVEASRKATCSVAEVMACLDGDELRWRGRRRDVPGMKGILLDADEIKQLTVLTDVPPGMTPTEFADDVGIQRSAARRLVQDGHLLATQIRHPVNRHSVPWIADDERRRFDERFISLRNLAAERTIWSRRLKEELASKGIRPYGGWDEFGAIVYERKQLL
jgi:hypothetical protein